MFNKPAIVYDNRIIKHIGIQAIKGRRVSIKENKALIKIGYHDQISLALI